MSDDERNERHVRVVTVEFNDAYANHLDVVLRTYQRGGHPLVEVGYGEAFTAESLLRTLAAREYRRLTGGDD